MEQNVWLIITRDSPTSTTFRNIKAITAHRMKPVDVPSNSIVVRFTLDIDDSLFEPIDLGTLKVGRKSIVDPDQAVQRLRDSL